MITTAMNKTAKEKNWNLVRITKCVEMRTGEALEVSEMNCKTNHEFMQSLNPVQLEVTMHEIYFACVCCPRGCTPSHENVVTWLKQPVCRDFWDVVIAIARDYEVDET